MRLNDRQECIGQVPPGPVVDPEGVLRYTHFSVVMNAPRRIACYTAVNIDGARWVNLERGDDTWYYDARLSRAYQLGDAFYGNKPTGRKGWFDRGHLVRRLDPVGGPMPMATLANDESFHWTNCAPQFWGFNQGEELWQGLENFILFNTDAEDVRATVFTGPLLQADDEEHRGVLIPQFFGKVVVVRDGRGCLGGSGRRPPTPGLGRCGPPASGAVRVAAWRSTGRPTLPEALPQRAAT